MFSGLLNSIGLAQNATTGLGNSAQAQYNQGIMGAAQFNAQAQAYNQMLGGLAQQRHEWMINGRTMSWSEWLDELAPGEDNPMRTFLTLKYRGTK